jgi:hypothetical protein
MRLKTSPKEALRELDNLIEIGYLLEADIADSTTRKTTDKPKNSTDWFERAEGILREVFLDFAPVYRFLVVREPKGFINEKLHPERIIMTIKGEVQRGLTVLLEYYNEISKDDISPLRYIDEKAEIWLYDICCKLEPESNEADLCKFMFNFGFGEYREIAEAHNQIVGEEYSPRLKNAKTVPNAIDGINEKTNTLFGFGLLSKKKSVLALSIPSRLIVGKS